MSDRSMRILHVAESARGGVGTYLAEVLPFQAEALGRGAVRALVPDAHASHMAGVDRRLVRTWSRAGRGLTDQYRLARAVQDQIRAFAPSIVHAHSSFAGLIVRGMHGWRSRPFRIVYCPHGWGFDRASRGWTDRAAQAVERVLAPACDRIVAISQHERRRGLEAGIAADKITVVLNGVAEAPIFRPAPWADERLRVLFVGRLDRQKGFDTLLDAVEPWLDRLCVRVVGKAVAGRTAPRISPRDIQLLGWRSMTETAAEMAAADVVVVPSRWEGFGLVALEAMRAGRPVVASDVGGLREVVVDGETGRLVPPDSPETLMRVLATVQRHEWAAMGAAGRRRYLSMFTADRMNGELLALYRTLEPSALPATRSPGYA